MKIDIINKTDFDLPKYETKGSVGMDLRANLDVKYLNLVPHKEYIVPTGIHIGLPEPIIENSSDEGWGYEAQIRPRSGLAAKHGISIVNTPGTIDCFSEDSVIKTINGNKLLKDLKINDIVLSVNDDKNIEEDTINAIVNTGLQEVLIIDTDDGVLEITNNTMVYTENGIKKASELEVDERILFYGYPGKHMKLTKIKSIKRDKKQTYDITVNKNHNFFCNNHLIHNCDYTGEIKIILINQSEKPYKIKYGDRIAQMVINRYERISWNEVNKIRETKRGEGGFGSTGT